ncbi:sigma-54 interaction domain-containing protein [Pseudalkalibacillus sp. A8]|uniref:sigma-54 interaction domain-containing protein n=1 Tax=Pseudalkalibacillus sp. A8 TaxID=3382641 RepID=UPI0038B69F89
MPFKLPQVKELLKKDFTFQEKATKQASMNERLTFFYKNDELFSKYKQKTPQKSTWITSDCSTEELIELLTDYPFALVRDQKNNTMGYIDRDIFFRRLHLSYQCLFAYYNAIMETMEASVSVVDNNGIVRVWTEKAEEIFSINKENILGKPMTDFFDEDKLEILETLKTGKALHRHQHLARSDRFVLINTAPIKIGGKTIGAVASEIDITSQVKLNQELSQTSAKLHHLERQVAKLNLSTNPFEKIRGSSRSLKKTINKTKRLASTNATVLIQGESGVGKELFAKAIHDLREKKSSPFIPINCGAIPSSLFESELFGYERGAFSGADQKGKKGKIELAKGGTLFLDEIGELPLEMQVKLLRVIQERSYYAVGGTKELQADIRIIAATNQDLKKLITEGKFREDLYYRLNVVNLVIPPLKDRTKDIIELTHYFLYEFSTKYHRPIHGISQQIMKDLLNHTWPGNVRELRNVIERLVVFSVDGVLQREDLPFLEEEHRNRRFVNPYSDQGLKEQLEDCEREIIINTLKKMSGKKHVTADALGITRATLYNRMKRLNIPIK